MCRAQAYVVQGICSVPRDRTPLQRAIILDALFPNSSSKVGLRGPSYVACVPTWCLFESLSKLGLIGPSYAVRGLTWCRELVPFRVTAHPSSGRLFQMSFFRIIFQVGPPWSVLRRPRAYVVPPFEPFTKLGLFGPPCAVRGLTWCGDLVRSGWLHTPSAGS